MTPEERALHDLILSEIVAGIIEAENRQILYGDGTSPGLTGLWS